jgi:phosphoketolase
MKPMSTPRALGSTTSWKSERYWATGRTSLRRIGAHAKEKYRDMQTDCCSYAYKHGIGKPEIVAWRWPY